MSNHELAEWMGLFMGLGLVGYVIRIIMCEIKHDKN
jgi:uncharacterized membrane protein